MKWYVGIFIGFAMGVLVILAVDEFDDSPSPYAEENARLQDSLKLERRLHDIVRIQLSITRQKFFTEIVKSKEREDSIMRAGAMERAALSREIKSLKNRTVKELEDEAERAFRERLVALDTIR